MLCPECRVSVTIETRAMTDNECESLDFPVSCPLCSNVAGAPYRATTVPQSGIMILLRCKACGHEWDCMMPSSGPDAILRPRSDRRQA